MYRPLRTGARLSACLLCLTITVLAQQKQDPMGDMDMSTPMNSSPAGKPMQMHAQTLIDVERAHTTSGTSIEPASTPQPMWMGERYGWKLMLHGTSFVSDTQQHAAACSGQPCAQRGGDKLFSTNWLMPMAMRSFGRGQLTLRTMLSLEPATVTGREYPELFQQGETAYGKPIVDGQHPHDFFMELAALYDLRLARRTQLSLYAAPVGDPALGPVAYAHRLSASEDPIAALGHHQQDSTHIAFNVLTAGLAWRWLRVEQSGFHGADPDEQRWRLQPSPNGLALDSYSTRLTVSPTRDWTGQYSIGHIASPESLAPNEDQQRQTASAMFNHVFGSTLPGDKRSGNIAGTLLWGRTRSLTDNSKENSYLAEVLVQWAARNHAWTRIENAGRSNELLLPPGSELPPNFHESPLGHVQAYTLGYDRDYHIAPHLLAAPGAQFTLYDAPKPLVSLYGQHPFGALFFVRFRLTQ